MAEILDAFGEPFGGEKPIPELRPIEVVPAEVEGRQMFVMRDPEMISESALAVSPEVVLVATMLDGEMTPSDVGDAFAEAAGGTVLERSDLDRIVSMLDEAYLLDTERFRERRATLVEEFRNLPVRPATCAGGAYPATGDEISELIDSLFTAEGGPGDMIQDAEDVEALAAIVPHIDIARGGREYAFAYHGLASSPAPDTVIVLGTAHRGRDGVFALTRKTFETPLGGLEVDCDLVDAIAAGLSWDPFEEEFLHKVEHTVEIQTIFLQHLWGGNPPRIVPVLCGSMGESIQSGTSPSKSTRVGEMVSALAGAVEGAKGRVLLLASVDLAHVGAQFGDEVPISARLLTKLEDEDMKMLVRAKDVDAEGFFEFVADEEDRRKVCGIPPIYVMLKVMEELGLDVEGRMTSYGQAHTEEAASVVTFAGMVFTAR